MNVRSVIEKMNRAVPHPCLLMLALIPAVPASLFLQHCEAQQGLVV